MLRFRPRLRFSLRTLFVLVTVMCVPLCWLGYQLNWISQRREALAAGRVISIAYSVSVPAPGLLWMFGERGHVKLAVMARDEWTLTEDVEMDRMKELFPEASIDAFQPVSVR